MMATRSECLPCFVGQTLETLRLAAPDDAATREAAMRQILAFLAGADWAASPPELARTVHRLIREAAGEADPYAAIKAAHNALATRLLPLMRERVAAAADPLRAALGVVMAANVIDLGINRDLTEATVEAAVDRALAEPIHGDTRAFLAEVGAAERILYLLDNCGEAVFDRLLIEHLPRGRLILAVRGGPIINDVTRADLAATGLPDLAPVIDNGDDAPGTVLGSCSPAFRAAFEAADLVVAKGQGNFETLHGCGAPVWFLLKAKCQVVADLLAVSLGGLVIRREGR